jgi:hypothetical protein
VHGEQSTSSVVRSAGSLSGSANTHPPLSGGCARPARGATPPREHLTDSSILHLLRCPNGPDSCMVLLIHQDAPNMKNMKDISDYLGGGASESEGEDAGAQVTLHE